MNNFDRRAFLEKSCVGASLTALLAAVERPLRAEGSAVLAKPQAALKKTYRAAAIGSTGHGDFGHGMDLALRGLPGVEFVAIADDDPTGLKKAGERCGIDRLYDDYRQMLDAEQIDLVTIGMRHSDVHEEVIVHCAGAGKHMYCEKPLASDLASFDRMVAACDVADVKLAVALTNRASPAIHQALAMVREGRLGSLRSLRAQGKCDHRGGGEDLIVLGYHNLDLMCLFAGQPQWTFAHVMEGNADATKRDSRSATEPVGPVAGDSISAMFGFPDQVHGHFQSHRSIDSASDRFSLEIHGSDGIIAARSLADVMWFEGAAFNPAKAHEWQAIAVPEWDALADKYQWCHQYLITDLLAAVEEAREPISGIQHTRWVQEMVQSVYASHLAQARVALPLKQRAHPLGEGVGVGGQGSGKENSPLTERALP
ncbi:MAG: Gfo/Idh/MocA family oxidoreductase [Pirellulales bacterium]